MKMASVEYKGNSTAAIWLFNKWVPLEILNAIFKKNWPTGIYDIICSGLLSEIENCIVSLNQAQKKCLNEYEMFPGKTVFLPLYEAPVKIWGIGLNYTEHASDLDEKTPEIFPGSFMKPSTTITGHQSTVFIPEMSEKTTCEAELAIIIGKKCRNVKLNNWQSVIAGFTTVLDMTAEDILRKNTRYLTLSKSFDSFLSIGPALLTTTEIRDVNKLMVSTVRNNKVYAENLVSNMTFSPGELVSFHSEVMTLKPGDIILTGTPGAVNIRHNDIIEARISGFETLTNNVIDKKLLKNGPLSERQNNPGNRG
jgi:2-keto-4-pentenoate hydratase/2-oxohepta-3-ene-1,7-dioic acid hydratase in catechol pathway